MEVTMNDADSGSRRQINRPLPVHVPTSAETGEWAEEPMSPIGRVMEDMDVYILVVMGLGVPINLPVFRTGIETELLTRFPRFRSIQVILKTSFIAFR
jgi:hypothetical protein